MFALKIEWIGIPTLKKKKTILSASIVRPVLKACPARLAVPEFVVIMEPKGNLDCRDATECLAIPGNRDQLVCCGKNLAYQTHKFFHYIIGPVGIAGPVGQPGEKGPDAQQPIGRVS